MNRRREEESRLGMRLQSKVATAAILVVTLLLLSSLSVRASADDALIKAVAKAMHAHNIAELRSLRPAVLRSKNGCVRVAYDLATFQIGKRADTSTFVRNFPDDDNLACAFQLSPQITAGNFDAYGWLQDSALHGNDLALRKVLLICERGDGAIGELVCDFVAQNARSRPEKVLTVLASLKDSIASRIASNSLAWCDSHDAIRRTSPTSARARALRAAILKTDRC